MLLEVRSLLLWHFVHLRPVLDQGVLWVVLARPWQFGVDLKELVFRDGLAGGELWRSVEHLYLLALVLSRPRGLLLLIQSLSARLGEEPERGASVLGACELGVMDAWAWVDLFELLSAVHEGLSQRFARAELRCSIFVLEMGLIVSGCWHLVDLFLNQIFNPLATGEPFALRLVLLDERSALVSRWTRGHFSVHKAGGLSELAADLGPGVGSVGELVRLFSFVVAASGGLLGLSEVLPVGSAHHYALLFDGAGAGVVADRGWLVLVVSHVDLSF